MPGLNWARSRISPVICMASSRVGARITAWIASLALRVDVLNDGDAEGEGLAGAGGALAVTSCQSIMGGMHPAWMGVDTS